MSVLGGILSRSDDLICSLKVIGYIIVCVLVISLLVGLPFFIIEKTRDTNEKEDKNKKEEEIDQTNQPECTDVLENDESKSDPIENL
jgi:Tfp pilus assembly protein PilO